MDVGPYIDGFFTGFSNTPRVFDSIWVIVDKLTKLAHFILIKISFTLQKLAEIYIVVIVKLDGIPSSIVSDRDQDSHPGFGRVYRRPWVLS